MSCLSGPISFPLSKLLIRPRVNGGLAKKRKSRFLAVFCVVAMGVVEPALHGQTTTPVTTSTTLSYTGSGTYTMQCDVVGRAIQGKPGPTGTVTLSDITTDQVLGSAALGSSTVTKSFQQAPELSIDGGISFIAVGDFNKDGIPDLAIANPNSSTVSVLLGNGDGTFQTQSAGTANPVGAGPDSLAVADLNGDGNLDIAVLSRGVSIPSTWTTALWAGGSVSVLLGNGDGTFQSAVEIADTPATVEIQSLGASRIVAPDLNKDGKPDLVVSGFEANAVSILLGRGDGSFAAPITYPAGVSPEGIAAGDFNNDGNPDLMVANLAGTGTLLIGNGDGTFKSQPGTDSYSSTLIAVDLNRDGNLDAIGGKQVWLGNGDGTFQYSPDLALPLLSTYGVSGIAAADFTGDGILDLAVGGTQWIRWGGNFGFVSILIGNGNGTFQTPEPYFLGALNGLSGMAIADFDRDGKLDIVTITHGSKDIGHVLFQQDLASAGISLPNIVVNAGTVSSHTIQCSYIGDAIYAPSLSNTATFTFSPAARPVFTLLVGKYPASQQVTIWDANSNTSIYFTADGSDPTLNSTLYTGPITVNSAVKLKAIAAGPAYLPSPVSEVVYQIAPAPIISFTSSTAVAPPRSLSGIRPRPQSTAQTATIANATPGAVIYYTTDGSTPSTDSTVYTAPITLTKTTTINAFVTATGYINSPIATASVTISDPTYSLSATPASVVKGASATSTVTVGSTTGYAGTISLICAVTASPAGAVDLPTCTSNQTVTLSSTSTSGTATITVHTTAAHSAALVSPVTRWHKAVGGSFLAFLILLWIPARRRLLQRMLAGFVLLILLGIVASCGGGSSNNNGPGTNPDPGTTSGDYSITISGTGNDSAQIKASTTFTLTVN